MNKTKNYLVPKSSKKLIKANAPMIFIFSSLKDRIIFLGEDVNSHTANF